MRKIMHRNLYFDVVIFAWTISWFPNILGTTAKIDFFYSKQPPQNESNLKTTKGVMLCNILNISEILFTTV